MIAPILEAIAEEQGGHRPGLLDGFLAKTGLDLSNPTIGSLAQSFHPGLGRYSVPDVKSAPDLGQ